MMGYKYCLFDSSSALWTIAPQKEKLVRKINAGTRDSIIYENCVSFFEFVLMHWKVDLLEPSTRDAIITAPTFVAAIWKAVTSKRIQFRLHSEYRAAHDKLVQSGVDPVSIPLPPELA